MALVEYLKSLPHISDVRGCQLTICEQTFEAARYVSTLQYDKRMDAVIRGEHKAGDEYSNMYFYLVGERPKKLKEQKRVLGGLYESKYKMTLPDDDGDWHVACYIDEEQIEPQFEPYHPFGANFILCRWPHEKFGQRIDHYDTEKRERLPVEVQWT